MSQDIRRLIKAYKKNEQARKFYWTVFNPLALFYSQVKERTLIRILKQFNMIPLNEKKILDIGCGEGTDLMKLILYGARPDNCFGIDVLEQRINRAKSICSGVHFQTGNAEKIEFPDETFDLVTINTVFTSILDSKIKKNIAKEALRIAKNDGIIIYFDCFRHKKQADYQSVSKKEITSFFAGTNISFFDCLLHITFAGFLLRLSRILAEVFEAMKLFSQNTYAVIRKKIPQ